MYGHEGAYHQVRWPETKAVPEYKVGVRAGSSGHDPRHLLSSVGAQVKKINLPPLEDAKLGHFLVSLLVTHAQVSLCFFHVYIC